MELAERLDDYGKPAWITAMILGFVFFWPLGLAILGYMIWSGRMGCANRYREHHWRCFGSAPRHGSARTPRRGESSGNAAFDEYRADTLKRLEDEFDDFQAFLEQLRMAKDKEEFDNFMASRKKPLDADASGTGAAE
jgi:hypothetical protein